MSERSDSKLGLLLWATCLASTVLVSVLLNASIRPPVEAPAAQAREPCVSESSVAELEARLERLEARLLELEMLDAAPTRMPVSSTAFENEALIELEQRLARLEGLDHSRHQQLIERADRGSTIDPGQQRAQFSRREAAHAIIIDPQSTDSAKARRWCDLSELKADAWTDEIVTIMTHIGATSSDDRARELVWIGADSRHRNPLLVQPLIVALSDPVANVREEAADALGHYLSVPGVRAALVWTKTNDSSDVVRAQALESLGEQ